MGAFSNTSTLGNSTEELEGDKVDSGGVYLGIHTDILAKPSQNEKARSLHSNSQVSQKRITLLKRIFKGRSWSP